MVMIIDKLLWHEVHEAMAFSASIRVQPGPANVYSHDGSLDRLNEFFSADELSNALWIGGVRATEAARQYLPPEFGAAKYAVFTGHCTAGTVSLLAERIGPSSSPVIGLGGGSALDTAKAVAARTGRPFVAIPTIAATCAAWTPLSVWYDEHGLALGFEVFQQSAFLTLIEPRILAAAPPAYLAAGIGDTLAKWYEAAVLSQKGELPLTARLGLDISRSLRDLLLEKGAAALEANRRGQPDAALLEVADAVIAGGGLVGGLGERFTRVAAAHAVHNGLTVLPETADILHGAKVAFGILVQLELQGETAERDRLRSRYARLGLPARLEDLGVRRDHPGLEAVVGRTLLPHESIHALPFTVTPRALKEALLA
jgi:uncharacterized oxidoreductase